MRRQVSLPAVPWLTGEIALGSNPLGDGPLRLPLPAAPEEKKGDSKETGMSMAGVRWWYTEGGLVLGTGFSFFGMFLMRIIYDIS